MGDRKRMNVEADRLSSLPDDLIHKILSFVSTKRAVETSVLSPRWRYIWTSMPYLNFSSKDFNTLPKLATFVNHVLSGRNNQNEVSSVDLTFRGRVRQEFVKRIMNYAFSHNVQQLKIRCLSVKIIDSILSRLCVPSLKHFTLIGSSYQLSIWSPTTWKMQALTTLNLNCVTLHDASTDKSAGFFSSCANLKNLTIKNCIMVGGWTGFNICHPGLTSLTLEDGSERANVDTPQLKNLAIKHWRGKHLISTPNLSSLRYTNLCYLDGEYYGPLQLTTDLRHLEKADICIDFFFEEKAAALKIVCLLQQLHSVNFLTLNLELVELLSSHVEIISHQPSPFANLKSLKIYPVDVNRSKVTMSNEVKKYLLDGSPDVTLTIVSHGGEFEFERVFVGVAWDFL